MLCNVVLYGALCVAYFDTLIAVQISAVQCGSVLFNAVQCVPVGCSAVHETLLLTIDHINMATGWAVEEGSHTTATGLKLKKEKNT